MAVLLLLLKPLLDVLFLAPLPIVLLLIDFLLVLTLLLIAALVLSGALGGQAPPDAVAGLATGPADLRASVVDGADIPGVTVMVS